MWLVTSERFTCHKADVADDGDGVNGREEDGLLLQGMGSWLRGLPFLKYVETRDTQARSISGGRHTASGEAVLAGLSLSNRRTKLQVPTARQPLQPMRSDAAEGVSGKAASQPSLSTTLRDVNDLFLPRHEGH